jgi:hypothetical protein
MASLSRRRACRPSHNRNPQPSHQANRASRCVSVFFLFDFFGMSAFGVCSNGVRTIIAIQMTANLAVQIVAAQSAPATPNQAAAVQSPQPLAPASSASASAAKLPTAPLRVDVLPTGTNGSAAGVGAGAAAANRVQDSQRVAAPARNPPPTNERPPVKPATATPAKVQLFPQPSKVLSTGSLLRRVVSRHYGMA